MYQFSCLGSSNKISNVKKNQPESQRMYYAQWSNK